MGQVCIVLYFSFWPLILTICSSTRGLDASTALEFVRALRIATDIARLSTAVSIYQASESLYQCFNKVCVIYEGKMAYYGPADQARQYFIDMGYEPASRQTTADFLVAVTDPFGRIERSDILPISPRTAVDFAAYFQKSAVGQGNRDDMNSYRDEFVARPERATVYIESVRAEHSEHTRQKSPYTISIPMQVRAVMVRKVQIIWGNMTAQVIQLA
jgi:ATP-binding cassette subfamily G (WHITE) protein 2 (SNQ2)